VSERNGETTVSGNQKYHLSPVITLSHGIVHETAVCPNPHNPSNWVSRITRQ